MCKKIVLLCAIVFMAIPGALALEEVPDPIESADNNAETILLLDFGEYRDLLTAEAKWNEAEKDNHSEYLGSIDRVDRAILAAPEATTPERAAAAKATAQAAYAAMKIYYISHRPTPQDIRAATIARIEAANAAEEAEAETEAESAGDGE